MNSKIFRFNLQNKIEPLKSVFSFERMTQHKMSFKVTYSLVSFAIQSTSPSTKLGDVQLLLLPNPVCILTISFAVFIEGSNWNTNLSNPFLTFYDILYNPFRLQNNNQICLIELMITK